MESHAKALGATAFGISKVKGKRYYVVYNNKTINFGSDVGSTFIDHHDKNKYNKQTWSICFQTSVKSIILVLAFALVISLRASSSFSKILMIFLKSLISCLRYSISAQVLQ